MDFNYVKTVGVQGVEMAHGKQVADELQRITGLINDRACTHMETAMANGYAQTALVFRRLYLFNNYDL